MDRSLEEFIADLPLEISGDDRPRPEDIVARVPTRLPRGRADEWLRVSACGANTRIEVFAGGTDKGVWTRVAEHVLTPAQWF